KPSSLSFEEAAVLPVSGLTALQLVRDAARVRTGDEVLVYSRKNGAQTYFYEFTRAFPYSTVSRDGVVYVSSRRYTVAFDETSGRPWWEQWRAVWNQFWIWGMAPDVPIPDRIWQNNDPPIQDGFPGTIAGDLLIIASKEGEMQALNRADGSEAWRVTPAEGETAVRGPLATQDGIVLPLEDRIALYDPATGELIAERPVEGGLSDVIVTTAGMFVLTQDGALTVIR
ncbi:MAG: PQQ-binding-like beta-propeller repeat protein, partial [Dehalococcoidia bacterium]|nr:PQQ-binding-like beta-propeller repeat protein [Dehalococcoidia bacterium]